MDFQEIEVLGIIVGSQIQDCTVLGSWQLHQGDASFDKTNQKGSHERHKQGPLHLC